MTDLRAWSVREGDWFGIFGERVTVVLPSSQKACAAAVWELVDDGAGFEEALDALVSAGLRELPDLVLVGRDGADARVLVRGRPRVEVTAADGVVTVEADPGTTWAERRLSGVTRVRIEAGGQLDPAAPAALESLVVATGLVRMSAAQCGSGAVEEERPSEALAGDAAPTGPMPATRPPAPPRAADAEHDGLTRAGTAPSPFARRQPGIPGQPPAPGVTRPVARLVFSTGETVDVDRAVLVGRAPVAGRVGPDEDPRLVAVHSPHQEISATHLEVRPGSGADHGTAVVTDLGSTNGTVLVQPGLPPEDLKAGVAVQLIPGAVIDLGDGVSIRATSP